MKEDLLNKIKKDWQQSKFAQKLNAALNVGAGLDFASEQINNEVLNKIILPSGAKNQDAKPQFEEVLKAASEPLILEQLEDTNKLFEAYDHHYQLGLKGLSIIDKGFTPKIWQELNNHDFALIPPVIIYLHIKKLEPEILANLSLIMNQNREFKIIVVMDQIQQPKEEIGRALFLNNHLDLGFFGLFFRNYYTMQIQDSLPAFTSEIDRALASPRPALISIYNAETTELGELALQTRAFPALINDPEMGLTWASTLDLSLNPEPDQGLISDNATLAHYLLATSPTFFKEVNQGGIPLLDWLESTKDSDEIAYIEMEGKKWALSHIIQEQLIASLQQWSDLQLMAGGQGPSGESESAGNLEITERIKIESQKAVEQAMENLSAKLLGLTEIEVKGNQINLKTEEVTEATTPDTATAQPSSKPAETAETAETAEEVWIESALCTACDECTGINPRIFAYNGEKQAIVLDPKAGTFADIVKAAEKCSATIIHPGKPLNLKEKNLNKWIKRAAKFN